MKATNQRREPEQLYMSLQNTLNFLTMCCLPHTPSQGRDAALLPRKSNPSGRLEAFPGPYDSLYWRV